MEKWVKLEIRKLKVVEIKVAKIKSCGNQKLRKMKILFLTFDFWEISIWLGVLVCICCKVLVSEATFGKLFGIAP